MTHKPPQPIRRGVGEQIFQTILDLHNAGRVATRQVVKEMTGQSYSVVDDHVKRMLEDGRLRRVVPGVFEPVEEMPETRAVFLGRLPSGMWKFEVGEFCVDLTPSEARTLASLLVGTANEMSSLQNARELADGLAEVRRNQTAAAARERERDDAIRALQGVPQQEEIAFN
ncbi:hypothetical protein [Variovorax sp. PMC12]|uniref:hypothetical protein n=1 Tax=Variovorax sp. PMC12 TaxID=2126319 RepID=UPI000D12A1A2|nr:hypothetical protein [Variovorax sp. PMC12]AVQ81668.1 hypothetical protein C4F17_12310 [Variovorax sp. PMC12]